MNVHSLCPCEVEIGDGGPEIVTLRPDCEWVVWDTDRIGVMNASRYTVCGEM